MDTTLNKEMQNKYHSLNKKLENLKNTQHTKPYTPNHNTNFYPRIVNNTDIKSSDEEITFLSRRTNVTLQHKQKNCITNLGLEAETAINLLPPIDHEHIRYQVTKNIQYLYTLQKSKTPKRTRPKRSENNKTNKDKIRRTRLDNHQSR